jgi:hypothetical protein
MSAVDFVHQQLCEQFTGISRLTAELALLRDRLMQAEIKIQILEETIAERDSEHVTASDSCVIKSEDTAIV